MASLDQAPENEALMLLALWLLALLLPQVSRLPLVPLVLVSRQQCAAGSVDHVLQAGARAKQALAASRMRMMRMTWKRQEPKKKQHSNSQRNLHPSMRLHQLIGSFKPFQPPDQSLPVFILLQVSMILSVSLSVEYFHNDIT